MSDANSTDNGEPPGSPKRMLPAWALASLCLLAGGIVTASVAVELYRTEHQRIEEAFEAGLDDKVAAIELRLRQDLEVLHAARALFQDGQVVDHPRFHRVVGDFLSRHGDIIALAYTPRVFDADKGALIEEMTREYGHFLITERRDGEMVEASPRPEYFPATLIEPLPGNDNVLGFDLSSDTRRRAALERARDTGALAMSGALHLLADQRRSSAFMAFLPIFDQPATSVQTRREHVTGFVYAVYRARDIVNHAIGSSADLVGLEVYDRAGTDTLLFANETPAAGLVHERVIENVGGRTWVIRARPGLAYVAQASSHVAAIAAVLGGLLSIAVSALLYVLLRHGTVVAREVRERTSELRRINVTLERLARNDPLTGLANRQQFDEEFASEWRRGQRQGHPLGVLLVEIWDYENGIVPRGQSMAEACVTEVAHALQRCVNRPGDRVARFGEQQFAILLPATQEVHGLARQCLSRVAMIDVEYAQGVGSVRVSACVGGGVIVPAGHKTPQEFLREVDSALGTALVAGAGEMRILGDDAVLAVVDADQSRASVRST